MLQLTSKDFAKSDTSWWICQPGEPRQMFYQRQAANQERMQRTAIGLLLRPNYHDWGMANRPGFKRRDDFAA